jgi:hypothetical protein
MKDQTPVQETYNSIPRPLYPEVKQYIEDLLNRGRMTKLKSPYSSFVICVCKKNGKLRLSVDYRELNKRTNPDRHPLPRVQDTLDGLGENCRDHVNTHVIQSYLYIVLGCVHISDWLSVE